MKGLGTLAVLWLLSSYGKDGSSSAPAAPRRASTRRPSALPLPPQHGFEDFYLLNAPKTADAEDQLWAKYAHDPKRPGPRASVDSGPVTRKLNAFERWALEPYFIDEDLDATIYNGSIPPAIDVSKVPTGIEFPPPGLHGATFVGPNRSVHIWLPKLRPMLWQRWDLSLLAHELTHGAQIRMGGQTPQEFVNTMLKYGYEKSPLEVQARWLQGAMLRDLDKRAAAFYGKPIS